jgi:hypothetical protein
MELVEGDDLSVLIARGSVPLTEAEQKVASRSVGQRTEAETG